MRPFLTAEWRRLLILSYPVSPEVLEPSVPAGTALDLYEGHALLSLVGFDFCQLRAFGRAPFGRDFAEINLRFYVRRTQGSETRRGVVFVREIVGSGLIAAVARLAFNEPYVMMPVEGRRSETPSGFELEYRWLFRGRRQTMAGRVAGAPSTLTAGSLQAFVTDRGWGYGRDRRGRTLEYRVEHAPWRTWPAQNVVLDCDVMELCGGPIGEAVLAASPLACVAEGSPISLYRASRLES